MGVPVEMNTVLKLSAEQGLPEDPVAGETYAFRKDGPRLYPLGVPVELIGPDWKTVGKAVIDEFTVSLEETRGRFRVVHRFDAEEAAAFNRVWRSEWV
jgi:hypothetical protein